MSNFVSLLEPNYTRVRKQFDTSLVTAMASKLMHVHISQKRTNIFVYQIETGARNGAYLQAKLLSNRRNGKILRAGIPLTVLQRRRTSLSTQVCIAAS